MPFMTDMLSNRLESRGATSLSSLKQAMPWLVDFVGGALTAAGKRVNETTAMTLTAVYSSIKIIAWNMASLPLITYKSLVPRGKERDKGYYLYKLLHDAPNPLQTSFEWIAMASTHQNLWGAGISEIEFDPFGNPVALWPIPPWCVTPKRVNGKRDLIYEVSVDGATYLLRPHQVLCFRALHTDMFGPWLSPIGVHRETIGMAVAVKEFGARTFGQGTNPAGVIETDIDYGEDSEESLKKMLTKYQGLGNEHRVMLLARGMKFSRIGLPPKDSQFLESRQFDIAEIARIYNMPLHKLQEHSKTTSFGAGIEEMNLDFVASTLRPYLVQWEQEIKRKLVFDDAHYVEFLIEGLLRGKLRERYEAYKTGINNGFLSPDDVREIENLNPIPGGHGDVYMVPLNMQAIEYARNPPDRKQAAPDAAGTDEDGAPPADDAKPDDKTKPPVLPDDKTGDDDEA